MDTTSDNLGDDLSAVLPLWLDLGYRINPNIYVGAFFQYAFGFINSDQNPQCSQMGTSCSASNIRLGVNVHYHISPGQPFDPWFGLGVGYDWLLVGVSMPGLNADVTDRGFEFANLQLGGDFMVSPTFRCGPFVSFSLGEYRSIKVSAGGTSTSMGLSDKGLHEWLLFGFKGAFDIGI